MKTAFFPRLAWTGIQKNKKLYIPYILSFIGMVMMTYIVQSLGASPLLEHISGGGNLRTILSLGKFVIAVFAAVFLFYTNSFLIRRRYKEFGLYNILGMDKKSICRIVVCESIITFVFGLAGGIVLGILFSKLAEMGLLNAIHSEVSHGFTVHGSDIAMTAVVFAAIFVLLLVKSLLQVWFSKPLEFVKSENIGEKPPKANWVIAVLGFLILASAYCISVSIKSPMTVIMLFFVAVIMVIIATYMLFMSGSVAVCKLLRKNKKYYYKKNHFVSVSSMAYRMKRNGAGLASICILLTMILVMISSTSSLYFGANDAIREMFPRNTQISVNMQSIDNFDEKNISQIREKYEDVFKKHSVTPKNVCEYRYVLALGKLNGDFLDVKADMSDKFVNYEDFRMAFFISTEDYKSVTGKYVSLEGRQVLMYSLKCDYKSDRLTVGDTELEIVGRTDKFINIREANTLAVPSLMIVVSDYDILRPLEGVTGFDDVPVLEYQYYYGYDIDAGDEETIAICNEQGDLLWETEISKNENGYGYYANCVAAERDDFFSTYGGMFFVGIILSVVFIFAAVMIIYYKQISEGYEDQSGFEIMQKVGMTKTDIRKSINSQVLTVFFAPLIFAGLHLLFAFPLVWKLLQLFGLHNLGYVILVTVSVFLIFGILYAIVYKLTARVYYSIVSGSSCKDNLRL